MKRIKRKIMKGAAIALALYLGWVFVVPHGYDAERAASYVTSHAAPHSRTMCALYVERAINAGGQPMFILPAWAYAYVLPYAGFEEVSTQGYKPMTGDIAVFPHVKGHIWGHIAMWNGHQWVSDFKQRSIYAASAYRNSSYRIFRHQ